MASTWPALPYDEWRDTCETLHAHTQVLGKLAAALAPPEPQLQHAALRLTARGWEHSRDGRKVTLKGELRDGDTLLVEATALFVIIDPATFLSRT